MLLVLIMLSSFAIFYFNFYKLVKWLEGNKLTKWVFLGHTHIRVKVVHNLLIVYGQKQFSPQQVSKALSHGSSNLLSLIFLNWENVNRKEWKPQKSTRLNIICEIVSFFVGSADLEVKGHHPWHVTHPLILSTHILTLKSLPQKTKKLWVGHDFVWRDRLITVRHHKQP